VKTSNLILLI